MGLFKFAYGDEKEVVMHAENITLETRILIDKQRIKQILANLLSNAIK